MTIGYHRRAYMYCLRCSEQLGINTDIAAEEVSDAWGNINLVRCNGCGRYLTEVAQIEPGDIIQPKGMAFYGTVTGEGTIATIPCWKIETPGGEASAIPKDQAIIMWKSEAQSLGRKLARI